MAVAYGVRPPDPAMGIEAALCPPAASDKLRRAALQRRTAFGAGDPVSSLYHRTADHLWGQEGTRRSLGQLPKRRPFD